jgi:hypothetical protein
VDRLWNGVSSEPSFLRPVATENWPCALSFVPLACRWPGERFTSQKELLLQHLHLAWREALAKISRVDLGRVGVLLASTKGLVEDVIWNGSAEQDLLTPLLYDFCRQAELQPTVQWVVSNACSSSLSALWMAREWLQQERVDSVIVLAVDGVGPFVLQGFQCLHALSAGLSKPFAGDRDGLQLGEAAAVLILSDKLPGPQLAGVAIDVEGYSVTRPSPSGESLKRALRQLPGIPDSIIAHGTGTQLNDVTEDKAFFETYGSRPWITGSKWSIGHTLGACGAVDTILACEVLRRGQIFALGQTTQVDAGFRGKYVTAGRSVSEACHKVLISSLGFGGVSAAALIEREGGPL